MLTHLAHSLAFKSTRTLALGRAQGWATPLCEVAKDGPHWVAQGGAMRWEGHPCMQRQASGGGRCSASTVGVVRWQKVLMLQ